MELLFGSHILEEIPNDVLLSNWVADEWTYRRSSLHSRKAVSKSLQMISLAGHSHTDEAVSVAAKAFKVCH